MPETKKSTASPKGNDAPINQLRRSADKLQIELQTDEGGEVVVPLEGTLPTEDVTTEQLVVVQGVELVVESVVLELNDQGHLVAQTEIESEAGTDTGAEIRLKSITRKAIVTGATDEDIRAEETLGIVAEHIADVKHGIDANLGITELHSRLSLRIVGDRTAEAGAETEPRTHGITEIDGGIGSNVAEI